MRHPNLVETSYSRVAGLFPVHETPLGAGNSAGSLPWPALPGTVSMIPVPESYDAIIFRPGK